MKPRLGIGFWRLSACLAILALALATSEARSQEGTVRGHVLDQVTLRPIGGVQVHIPEQGIGTLTDEQGNFLLQRIPAGEATIRAQRVGYGSEDATVQVPAGGVVEQHFELRSRAINLDEVVVSGTGGATQRRQLGQTITSISSADLERAPISSVAEALQGRIPGMAGLATGEVGAAPMLLLRGTASLSQRNEPLIYVDGVRVDNRRYSLQGLMTDRLGDINPGDVERIEVIKGAAAATLFGTEAGSGVIQIFTRRGRTDDPVFTFQMDQHMIHLPHSKWPITAQYDPATREIIRMRPAEDFVKLGHHQNYALSVQGGTPGVQYFVSGRWMDATDPQPAYNLTNASFRSTFDFQHTPRLRSSVDFSAVTSEQQASHVDWSGVASDFVLAEPIRATPEDPHGRGGGGIARMLLNEYRARTNNLLLSGSITYDITDNVLASLRIGYNDIKFKRIQFAPRGATSDESLGSRSIHGRDSYATTVDASLSWNASLTDRITSNLTLGAQSFWEGITTETMSGSDFPSPTLRTLGAAANIGNINETQQDVINAGLFAQEQIGLDDRLFLTIGVRMDGNSAFGEDFGLTTYPKAGVSWVVSDYGFWNVAGVDELRIRGAVGTSGLQPGAFDSHRTWSPGAFVGGGRVFPGNLGNPGLRPERSTEREIAVEAGLFGGRAGLEAIYFNQTTTDALIEKSEAPSLGFTSPQLVNIGELTSQGVELITNISVMQRPRFGWDVHAAYTWIQQEVTDMGGVPDIRIEGRRRWSWIKEGYRPGVVIGPMQDPSQPYVLGVSDPADLTGVGQVAANTLKAADGTDSLVVHGNSLPSWTVDFGSSLRLGQHLTLRALFTGAGGFIMSNETEVLRGGFLINEFTANVVKTLADPNARPEEKLAAADAYGRKHPDVIPSYFEAGDWLKLQELTLSFDLPQRMSDRLRLGRTSLLVGGRSLILWTKYSGILDPGASGGGSTGTSAFLQNIDYLSAPSPRRYVLSIRMTR